jgi:AcrR family transcriptional regulator
VLEVAVVTLAENGVSAFTTREVARRAHTSTAALYELFGDKTGLIRAVFFEAFKLLRRDFEQLDSSDAALTDLVRVVTAFRSFIQRNPVLAELMFSRPFPEFVPGPRELAAGSLVREFLVERVRRCLDDGLLIGDEADIAHVIVALIQGLAVQEAAGWLGTSKASVDHRWTLAIRALLDGLSQS